VRAEHRFHRIEPRGPLEQSTERVIAESDGRKSVTGTDLSVQKDASGDIADSDAILPEPEIALVMDHQILSSTQWRRTGARWSCLADGRAHA
jgi:hypothetical protein